MPRKKRAAAPAADAVKPRIPKELLEQLITAPIPSYICISLSGTLCGSCI